MIYWNVSFILTFEFRSLSSVFCPLMSFPDHPPPESLRWLRSESVSRIMDALRGGGGEARVVGGAVRDALLGRKVGDIDLAATLPPEKTSALLTEAGIKVVPTGIEHGTITAVIDGKGYEITTLRKDVETDGRRAKVAFTDDWQSDAARRDFTINALYADANGKIYDYFGGREDLAKGHVRFIGDAGARIREDVLRILRFFRFYVWFGQGAIDAEGMEACRALAGLIPQLSVERVWREIVKLLGADNPLSGWRSMLEARVLAGILPEASDSARLGSLLAVEKKYDAAPSPLRRLAALLPSDEVTAVAIIQRLKLSKREAGKLLRLASLPALLAGKLDPIPFRRALYEFGIEDTSDAALLLAAEHPALDLEPALAAAAAWDNPVFPLQGQDLLKLGLAAGPAMGLLLRALEEEWVAADFKPSREECLASAKRRI
jgi:poly(A) polymerase